MVDKVTNGIKVVGDVGHDVVVHSDIHVGYTGDLLGLLDVRGIDTVGYSILFQLKTDFKFW